MPNVPRGSCRYNLTLINRCYPPSSLTLKEEPMFGTDKCTVSWHADSSLEHFRFYLTNTLTYAIAYIIIISRFVNVILPCQLHSSVSLHQAGRIFHGRGRNEWIHLEEEEKETPRSQSREVSDDSCLFIQTRIYINPLFLFTSIVVPSLNAIFLVHSRTVRFYN